MVNFGVLCSVIEHKLSTRNPLTFLTDRNIIREQPFVSSKLQAALQMLKFQFTQLKLAPKLVTRPTKLALVDINILKEDQATKIAPRLSTKLESLRFRKRVQTIQTRLIQRPSRASLIAANILNEGSISPRNISPRGDSSIGGPWRSGQRNKKTLPPGTIAVHRKPENRLSLERPVQIVKPFDSFLFFGPSSFIQERASFIRPPAQFDFDRTAEILEEKLEKRPRLHTLIEAGILKGNFWEIAPSLHATRHSLSKQLSNFLLAHKIAFRPTKGHLQDINILKPEQGSGIAVEGLARRQRAETLIANLLQRPSLEQLIQQHVLLSSR